MANTMEERSLISGFNTSKNTYVKNTLNKTHKNNSSGPPNFKMSIMSTGPMADQRNLENSSEMIQQKEPVDKSRLTASKAHVPKLLLTQANVNFAKAFANHPSPLQNHAMSPELIVAKKLANDDMAHMNSIDTYANAKTNADSMMINSQAFGMGSQEDTAIRQVFD